MYRFALRPRWLLSHLFALSLVVLFVNLGFWQLRRHDEKVDQNATIAARTEAPPVAVGELGVAALDDPDSLRYRPATAEGSYLPGADVVVDNRSNEGLPGAWVLSPLQLDDGRVVVINRGFQGFVAGAVDAPAPAAGTVSVTGTLVPWDGRDCGVRRDDAGTAVGSACLRRDVIEGLLGESVLPVVVQRASSSPADVESLVPVPLPELDDGPHRSYAVQWFIFATIGAVGYPLILRRVARDRSRESVDAE